MWGLLLLPLRRIAFCPKRSVIFISFLLFLLELIDGWREPASVVRRGSLEPWPEEPLVVVVAVEGKKLALPPYLLYWVWFILICTSFGFLMGSARLTTRLLPIVYLSGETLYFMPRALLIISFFWRSTHLVPVIEVSIKSDFASSFCYGLASRVAARRVEGYSVAACSFLVVAWIEIGFV